MGKMLVTDLRVDDYESLSVRDLEPGESWELAQAVRDEELRQDCYADIIDKVNDVISEILDRYLAAGMDEFAFRNSEMNSALDYIWEEWGHC